ncbi:hypothetical protein SAMN05216276_1028103 [Streptosporangium subroseum]|uniref:Ig-like domain (Group 3) n=1 Tax=Streptosporangium subroseum TaxID=106412 RepID=A0A239KRN6_9ACTN|nr:hypothetical protein [Streptosporangium subroseum]SNT21017.1 hypothetical protein SAMN05216276_1028103 [Streptosporangium subroseum]
MRFAKPLAATVLGMTLIGVPFAGSALADSGYKPAPTKHAAPAKPAKPAKYNSSVTSLRASVSPGEVKQGGSYTVSILARGAADGATATVTSPQGRSYSVTVTGQKASKTLTVASDAELGDKTVTVTVGNKTATAEFTVISTKKHRNHK